MELSDKTRTIFTWIFDIFFIIITLTFIYFLYQLVKSTGPFFVKHFDNKLLVNLLLTFLVLWIIGFFSHAIIGYFSKRFSFQVNWWFWGTIGGIIAVFIFGVVFTVTQLEVSEIKLVTRDANNISTIRGNITCEDDSKHLLAENLVHCEVYPALTNITAEVAFYSKNGTTVENFSNYTFIAKPGTERILFTINGINESNGEIVNLSTANNVKFLTAYEDEQRNERFITLIIALLGICLFSVPSMMSNFRSLSKKDSSTNTPEGSNMNSNSTPEKNFSDLVKESDDFKNPENQGQVKQLFYRLYELFPNGKTSEEMVHKVLVTEDVRKSLVKNDFITVESTQQGKKTVLWYGLGPNGLALINSWNMEDLAKKAAVLTVIGVILTIVGLILTMAQLLR